MQRRMFGLGGLAIALGLAAGGFLVSQGLTKLRTADRYVTVKGSAEKLVDADLVVWPVAHSVTGNDLGEVQSRLDARTQTVRSFFTKAGFTPEELSIAPPSLEDRWAYSQGPDRVPERYRFATTVTLRSSQVAKALALMPNAGQLIAQGVVIGGSGGEGGTGGQGPSFEYTQLNAVKPALIAEATANARRSAEQFAKDSGARIGGIRTANQGVIDISERDIGSPQVKKVRVVTTVEYFLAD